MSTTIQITPYGDEYAVKTPYHAEFINSLKTLHWTTRKWDKLNKVWLVKKEVIDNVLKILTKFWDEGLIHLPDELKNRIEVLEKAKTAASTVETDEEIEMNGKKLYHFQCGGVKFLEIMGKGIIADQMGLGKTAQSLAVLKRNKDWYPALVVAPSSVKMNWAREIMNWLTSSEVSCDVIDGNKAFEINEFGKKNWKSRDISTMDKDSFADITICNYEMLERNIVHLKRMNVNTIIFDESHFLKNNKSKRSKAAYELSRGVKHIVMLTGTPVMNRPIELWFPLHILDDTAWPNMFGFATRYCNAYKNRYGWDFSGSSNLDELHELLIGKYMVRRKKKDVFKDMPDKVVYRSTLDIEDKDRKEYNFAVANFRQWALSQGINKARSSLMAEALTRLTTLKRLAAEAKVNEVIDHANEFLTSREDDKLVIFGYHRSVLNRIEGGLKNAGFKVVTITGEDTLDQRQDALETFKNDKGTRVIVCSIMTAGAGIDGLQAAHNMMFVERTWRPSDHQQAEDRIHRIGQTEACFIEYLDMENSIDEYMAKILENKAMIAAQVIDGKIEQDNFVDEVMDAILNER